jgi:hypothetical protein
MEDTMREAVSLFVMFVVVAILYEYMKPKNKNQSTEQQNELNDEED